MVDTRVAMSRMKKKLVIIASESVFRVTPADADEFDQTVIWQRLYNALQVTDEVPETLSWEGSIAEFCPDLTAVPEQGDETSLSVYTLQTED